MDLVFHILRSYVTVSRITRRNCALSQPVLFHTLEEHPNLVGGLCMEGSMCLLLLR